MGYLLARTFFDMAEYDRCAHALSNVAAPKALFLRGYAKFMAGERAKMERLGDPLSPADVRHATNEQLVEVLELVQPYLDVSAGKGDAWLHFLHGLVHARLGNSPEAVESLAASIALYPYNWSAWEELANLMVSENLFASTRQRLPESFMKQFFAAHCVLHRAFDIEEVQPALKSLRSTFSSATGMVPRLVALCLSEQRLYAECAERWESINAADPYCLDGLVSYANALFALGKETRLGFVAHNALAVDRQRPEPWIAVGNLHSLRAEHAKAAESFRRAIALQRDDPTAWVLLGHECIELKQTEAAAEAFQRALDLNPRDCRALYGLGNMYQLLGLHAYSLHHWEQACAIRPTDARMWGCLAHAYHYHGAPESALRACKRAVAADPAYLDPDIFALIGSILASRRQEPALPPPPTSTTTPPALPTWAHPPPSAPPTTTAASEDPIPWFRAAWAQRTRALGASDDLRPAGLVATAEALFHHALAGLAGASDTMALERELDEYIRDATVAAGDDDALRPRVEAMQRALRAAVDGRTAGMGNGVARKRRRVAPAGS
ncbi:Anaphase-promoting complex subunit 8 [Blastocladiella emersonii ATCC 22665]|nr:Anaphase-promoting complex subunit 8 [Blastocladiella emersonii ATCC 22665]